MWRSDLAFCGILYFSVNPQHLSLPRDLRNGLSHMKPATERAQLSAKRESSQILLTWQTQLYFSAYSATTLEIMSATVIQMSCC